MTMRAKEITDEMVAANIPIDGVSIDQLGAGSNITVQFRPEATKEQQDAAKVIVDSYKAARPRRKKAIAALITEILALQAGDRNKLFAYVAACMLLEDPKAARRLNITLDGDEEV